MKNVKLSGFADEICTDLEEQMETVVKLGMKYISFRSAYGKNVSEYSVEEFKEKILPVLNKYNVSISSIGSPIGKIKITDEELFIKHKEILEKLCEMAILANCKYVRMFSFYMIEGENPENYKNLVISKIKEFTEIAKKYNIILVHENEKGIYGDVASRCLEIVTEVNSPYLKNAFDFANFVQCNEDIENCYNLLKDCTEYIHIKDAIYGSGDIVVCGNGEGKVLETLEKFINAGYDGFLTIEPHLVIFDSLKDLEVKDVKEIIKTNSAKTGAEGYTMQYNGLVKILDKIL